MCLRFSCVPCIPVLHFPNWAWYRHLRLLPHCTASVLDVLLQVKNPGVDMPVGIVGCISFVTMIYTAMALCLVMMVPYTEIDISASFATAFTQVGYPWGQVRGGLSPSLKT
jgi:hypothetical protein